MLDSTAYPGLARNPGIPGAVQMEKIKAFLEGAWIVPVFIVSTIVFALAVELALRITN